MSKLDRQFAIGRKLAGRPEGYTLLELAKDFSVAKNTVQRDIDGLSAVGVPIQEMKAGQTTRYWIDQAFSGPPLALTALEQAALDAAGAAIKNSARTPITPAFETARSKLGAAGPKSAFASGPVTGPPIAAGVFESLLQAIMEDRVCEIEYTRRGSTKPKTYRVDPHHFYSHGGVLYLRAGVPPHPGLTVFLVHRIHRVAVQEEHFKRRKWTSTGFGIWEERPERVEVLFHQDVAAIIEERKWHPTQKTSWRGDGKLLFKARLGGRYEFVGWVMSWGPHAELIRPPAWRNEVLTRSRELVRTHQPREGR